MLLRLSRDDRGAVSAGGRTVCFFVGALPCGDAVGFAVFGRAIRGGAPLLQMGGVYAFV